MHRSLLLLLLPLLVAPFTVPPPALSPIHSFKSPRLTTARSFGFDSILLADILPDATATVVSSLNDAATAAPSAFQDTAITTYDNKSYYATLGLYVLSFPGLWSTIKRSTKTKVVRKTFVTTRESFTAPELKDGETAPADASAPGPRAAEAEAVTLKSAAANIFAYMRTNNYKTVGTPGKTIKFEGIVKKSKSQAFFLTFVTALCLASLALVAEIQFKGGGVVDGNGGEGIFGLPPLNWFYLCFLSPYAGVYYWKGGDRVDNFEIKLTDEGTDEKPNIEVNVLGGEEEVDRMWRSLKLMEKGMVEVKGLL